MLLVHTFMNYSHYVFGVCVRLEYLVQPMSLLIACQLRSHRDYMLHLLTVHCCTVNWDTGVILKALPRHNSTTRTLSEEPHKLGYVQAIPVQSKKAAESRINRVQLH